MFLAIDGVLVLLGFDRDPGRLELLDIHVEGPVAAGQIGVGADRATEPDQARGRVGLGLRREPRSPRPAGSAS